jgi:formylglycine-generating enzyme required for sulfatase activity
VARKFVPFGTYQYRIEAKMYHPETGSVEVNDPNNKTQVSAQLKPSFGYIKIPKDGGLEGATIYIDKEIVGKAPLTSEPLSSGQHTVMAVKPLYRSSEQTVTVQDGQTLSVAPVLTADYATVTFQVANQAEIWVNGERKGVGEWSGDLAAGDYMVETRLDRHRTVAVTKHISSDQRQQTLRLDAPTPICGGLNVSTTPDMADVYVDDQLSGQTPLFLQQCLIGEHQVRVSKANFGDYVTKVNVQEGQIAEVSGALSNLAGVQLSCNAPAAQVFVDGVSRGSLSVVTQLGYGKHEIALQAEGFNDYSATIEVSASQRKFSFTMQPKQGEKQTFTVKGVTFTLIQVKGGTFQMGATAEQKNAYGDEKPVRAVTLSNYYIAESEVTQALWQAVMGTNPSNFKGDNRPVERVSWDDCQAFLQKLNALTGRQFRLPSEAEWEYAARGGSKSKHYIYSGSNMSGEVAYTVENSSFQTHDVKSKRPNELGLYDMSGNVFEWCQDWKGTYSAKAETDPKGPSSGTARVFRGGSWFQEGGSARVAIRGFHTPTSKLSYVGLRLAL